MTEKQQRGLRSRRKMFLAAVSGAAALVTIGLFQNQTQAVLEKAARICLECVGIG